MQTLWVRTLDAFEFTRLGSEFVRMGSRRRLGVVRAAGVVVPGTVQRIVDVIGAQIDRPVLVEDPTLRVVAYSEHDRTVDTVRRNSILERHTSREVMAWCRAAGVHASRRPVRVMQNDDLDFQPRVCVPVYFQDLLLGFVWFIDLNFTLTDEDLVRIDGELASLSAAMYEEHFHTELALGRERAAAATLLMDDAASAEHAAEQLLRDGVFQSDGPTSVLVARFVEPTLSHERNRALEHCLGACRDRFGANNVLTFVRGNHGALLVRAKLDAQITAKRLYAAIVETTDESDTGGVVIGIGGVKERLAGAAVAYDEAVRAAQVGALVPAAGPVSDWVELGIYRMLSRDEYDVGELATIHPGLARLVEDGGANESLFDTLETYLDLAGSASATSAALHLHRTTLYYRLQRIEQLASTDLKDGNERLCLHVAVKLWRLHSAVV